MTRLRAGRGVRVGAGSRRGWPFAAKINVYALALNTLWTPLNSILLARKIELVASPSTESGLLGLLTLIGVGLAALVQPLAGHLSDHANLPRRRVVFIVGGTAVGLPCLALIWWASSFWGILLGYALLQVAMNFAQAALQALIPDLVPSGSRGVASGIKNAYDVLGGALGLAGTSVLLAVAAGAPLAFIAVVLVAGAALSWFWVPPDRASIPAARVADTPLALLRTFIRAFRDHPRFAWTVLLRFLFLLGFYPVQRFLLYDLQVRYPRPQIAPTASIAALVALLLAAISAVAAGAISDRVGRRTILAGSIVLEVMGLLGIALAPTLVVLFAAGVVLSVGGGAFQGVTWAILSDSMPSGRGATYYGLANLATAGASALAGLFGPLESGLALVVGRSAFPVAYGIAALVALTSLLPLRRIDPTE